MTLSLREQDLERQIRASLDGHETVLAVGACHETSPGIDAHTHARALVTTDALRWAVLERPRAMTTVRLDTVRSATESFEAHRCGIWLEHSEIDRVVHAPAHRFLMFEWGNAQTVRRFTVTALEFSRRDTEVAVALRGELERRGVATRTASG